MSLSNAFVLGPHHSSVLIGIPHPTLQHAYRQASCIDSGPSGSSLSMTNPPYQFATFSRFSPQQALSFSHSDHNPSSWWGCGHSCWSHAMFWHRLLTPPAACLKAAPHACCSRAHSNLPVNVYRKEVIRVISSCKAGKMMV